MNAAISEATTSGQVAKVWRRRAKRNMAVRIDITTEVVTVMSFTNFSEINYIDKTLPGFCLRVGVTRKSYFLRKLVGRKLVRINIGAHGDMTAEDARAAAILLTSKMDDGFDPRVSRKQVKRIEPMANRLRLRLPKIDAGHFRSLTEDYGGPEFVARDLKIEYELFSRWYKGELEPPYHLLVAMWFMSTWGINQAFSESHWAHQENSMLKNEARRETQQLRTVLERVKGILGSNHPALLIDGAQAPLGVTA